MVLSGMILISIVEEQSSNGKTLACHPAVQTACLFS